MESNMYLALCRREFLVVARARVGWGKGNTSFSCGAFCFAKYALQIRRKNACRSEGSRTRVSSVRDKLRPKRGKFRCK